MTHARSCRTVLTGRIALQSCATGHQSGGGGQRWTLHRNAKLRMQAAEAESQALKGVIAYINGYTGAPPLVLPAPPHEMLILPQDLQAET